jgi:hypothetical protein
VKKPLKIQEKLGRLSKVCKQCFDPDYLFISGQPGFVNENSCSEQGDFVG